MANDKPELEALLDQLVKHEDPKKLVRESAVALAKGIETQFPGWKDKYTLFSLAYTRTFGEEAPTPAKFLRSVLYPFVSGANDTNALLSLISSLVPESDKDILTQQLFTFQTLSILSDSIEQARADTLFRKLLITDGLLNMPLVEVAKKYVPDAGTNIAHALDDIHRTYIRKDTAGKRATVIRHNLVESSLEKEISEKLSQHIADPMQYRFSMAELLGLEGVPSYLDTQRERIVKRAAERAQELENAVREKESMLAAIAGITDAQIKDQEGRIQGYLAAVTPFLKAEYPEYGRLVAKIKSGTGKLTDDALKAKMGRFRELQKILSPVLDVYPEFRFKEEQDKLAAMKQTYAQRQQLETELDEAKKSAEESPTILAASGRFAGYFEILKENLARVHKRLDPYFNDPKMWRTNDTKLAGTYDKRATTLENLLTLRAEAKKPVEELKHVFTDDIDASVFEGDGAVRNPFADFTSGASRLGDEHGPPTQALGSDASDRLRAAAGVYVGGVPRGQKKSATAEPGIESPWGLGDSHYQKGTGAAAACTLAPVGASVGSSPAAQSETEHAAPPEGHLVRPRPLDARVMPDAVAPPDEHIVSGENGEVPVAQWNPDPVHDEPVVPFYKRAISWVTGKPVSAMLGLAGIVVAGYTAITAFVNYDKIQDAKNATVAKPTSEYVSSTVSKVPKTKPTNAPTSTASPQQAAPIAPFDTLFGILATTPGTAGIPTPGSMRGSTSPKPKTTLPPIQTVYPESCAPPTPAPVPQSTIVPEYKQSPPPPSPTQPPAERPTPAPRVVQSTSVKASAPVHATAEQGAHITLENRIALTESYGPSIPYVTKRGDSRSEVLYTLLEKHGLPRNARMLYGTGDNNGLLRAFSDYLVRTQTDAGVKDRMQRDAEFLPANMTINITPFTEATSISQLAGLLTGAQIVLPTIPDSYTLKKDQTLSDIGHTILQRLGAAVQSRERHAYEAWMTGEWLFSRNRTNNDHAVNRPCEYRPGDIINTSYVAALMNHYNGDVEEVKAQIVEQGKQALLDRLRQPTNRELKEKLKGAGLYGTHPYQTAASEDPDLQYAQNALAEVRAASLPSELHAERVTLEGQLIAYKRLESLANAWMEHGLNPDSSAKFRDFLDFKKWYDTVENDLGADDAQVQPKFVHIDLNEKRKSNDPYDLMLGELGDFDITRA